MRHLLSVLDHDMKHTLVKWTGALALALCVTHSQFELSWGADGASLKVNPPEVGAPPAPGSTWPATPQDTSPQDDSSVVPSDEQAGTADIDSASTSDEVESAESILDDAWDAGLDSLSESAAAATDETVELSVDPGRQPVLPADRPAWVASPPDLSTDTHRLFVGSVPASDPEAAASALNPALIANLHSYIDDHVLNERGAAAELDLTSTFIRKNLMNQQSRVMLELNTPGEPMFQEWVTLEISPEQRAQFQQWHQEVVQRNRLAPIGIGLAGLLGLVGFTHVLLRRKHGLSTVQPLTGNGIVANENIPRAKSSGWGSIFAFLAVTGVLAIGFPLLLGLFFISARHEQTSFVMPKVTVKSHGQSHSQSEIYTVGEDNAGSESSDHRQEFIIETNGQTIHVKRR